MTRKATIPKRCCKYYAKSSLDEFVEAGIAKTEETQLLEEFVSKLLELKGMKLLGWAKARDRYIDVLAYYEIGYVCVIEDEHGQKVLADVSDDSVNILSREVLDSYF